MKSAVARSLVTLVAASLAMACRKSPPTPEPSPPMALVPIAPSPDPPAPVAPPASASVEPARRASAVPDASSANGDAAPPASIACKTDDDCWLDDDHKPIARPKNLRGKRFKPCKDSEHIPVCRNNACLVNALKC